MAAAADLCLATLRAGGTLFVVGNGGSAADAQHIAAEFVGRFRRERSPLPAVALTTDTSALTAIANDYGFEWVFSRQLRALARAGDTLIAISTSGESPNVLRAAEEARSSGIRVVALTGGSGGALARCADVSVAVPSGETRFVQESHVAIAHALCDVVEAQLEEGPGAGPARATRSGAPARVLGWEALIAARGEWRRDGLTVVWTNGCFDLLHRGHVRSLEAAKALGDVLVVGLNSDASVRALKGPARPVMPEGDRAEILAALRPVDAVTIFDDLTPVRCLEELQPDVHCKGGEYDGTDRTLPEREVVERYGGTVRFLPMVEGVSTSRLIGTLGEGG